MESNNHRIAGLHVASIWAKIFCVLVSVSHKTGFTIGMYTIRRILIVLAFFPETYKVLYGVLSRNFNIKCAFFPTPALHL